MSYLMGIDVGSTTVKVVILDERNEPIFTVYKRHFSDIFKTVKQLVARVVDQFPDILVKAVITGSGGMGLAEILGLKFVQEVVACTKTIEEFEPETDVAIELGGEDAKITFFTGNLEQRMNGSCAGGTGVFIDQMSSLLKTDAAGLNELAKNFQNIYPIASRCGVFAKTDLQPLINEGARKEDLAVSIFQAVVNQTIAGLASGRKIRGKVALLGGPLSFLSELRQRFIETLNIAQEDVLFPKNSELFVAMGAALLAFDQPEVDLRQLKINLEQIRNFTRTKVKLEPLFKNEEELIDFRTRHAQADVKMIPLSDYQGSAFLGIDAGSTTSKLVLLGENKELLFSYYANNNGEPLENIRYALQDLYRQLPKRVKIARSAVTGYGEKLIKNALKIDLGEVETVAHYKAATYFYPEVDFILDIGGQDMKVMTIKKKTLASIQLNEACSSGCGSFIESFAESLHVNVEEFANSALTATYPVDLGNRCTVFMNSKVKQAQKEGATLGDISAGLSYSVIKNALYKVIKMRQPSDLGKKIVVQGGTFYNDAILRAFEKITGQEVIRPTISGLMGAFGAAIIALENFDNLTPSKMLSDAKLADFSATKDFARCGGCPNNCRLTLTHFSDDRIFLTGNRCEQGEIRFSKNKQRTPKDQKVNLVDYKYRQLFKYRSLPIKEATLGTIGIPRVLNIYENYPLWITILNKLGFKVVLSPRSAKELYETGIETIPSDTVCYPAKMVHGHIQQLINLGVKRIFYPSIVYEQIENKTAPNHFNCPVVQSYPEVIRNNIDEIITGKIKMHHPFLNLADVDSVINGLFCEFADLNLSKKQIRMAVVSGFSELEQFKAKFRQAGEKLLKKIVANDEKGIVLAARPYHIDPEINHGIANIITQEGFHVLTEDAVSHLGDVENLRVVNQWVYHSRLFAAAKVVNNFKNLELVQLNSFSCGLDAIVIDQVTEIMERAGKIHTVLKIDEGDNLGAVKIRIRSLKAAVLERERKNFVASITKKQDHPPIFTKEMKKNHTLLLPVLSPIHQFGLLEEAFNSEGYQVVTLPALNNQEIELGLKYVNNDACYPAIIVIGQLIEALASGKYDLDHTSVMMTQTGGGCRATNYLALLKKALKDAGFAKIPIVSLSFSNQGVENTPGFKFDYRLIKKALIAIFYGDLLERVVLRTRPFEKKSGTVNHLYQKWLEKIKPSIWKGSLADFKRYAKLIINDFDNVEINDQKKVKVGLVGEILVKYSPIANNDLVVFLESQGAEVIVPDIIGFFKYSLYNRIFMYQKLGKSYQANLISKIGIKIIEKMLQTVDKALRSSKHFSGLTSIKSLADHASEFISLGNQTGEGWLLTAEMVGLLKDDINNIICLQPFGCLPNHIVGKGTFKILRNKFPKANITPIDYDPGASFVNQLNRIRLMLATAKNKL